MAEPPYPLAHSTLPSVLRLLAMPYADQAAGLPGYTPFGIYQECVLAVRDNIDDIVEPLRLGLLPPAAAAAIIECYILLEALSRHPSDTNSAEAFAQHPLWQKVRVLATTAADLSEGPE